MWFVPYRPLLTDSHLWGAQLTEPPCVWTVGGNWNPQRHKENMYPAHPSVKMQLCSESSAWPLTLNISRHSRNLFTVTKPLDSGGWERHCLPIIITGQHSCLLLWGSNGNAYERATTYNGENRLYWAGTHIQWQQPCLNTPFLINLTYTWQHSRKI